MPLGDVQNLASPLANQTAKGYQRENAKTC
jgi:hypothetical protein